MSGLGNRLLSLLVFFSLKEECFDMRERKPPIEYMANIHKKFLPIIESAAPPVEKHRMKSFIIFCAYFELEQYRHYIIR